MAPLISATQSLPGRTAFNPRRTDFPSEGLINLRVPLMFLQLSSHHTSSHILTHCSSTSPAPHPVIDATDPGQIHQAWRPCRQSTSGPGPLVHLGPPLSSTLCGVSSSRRRFPLRRGWCRWWGRKVTHAGPQAPRERQVVEEVAVIYPRSWTVNQVGQEHGRTFSVCYFLSRLLSSSVNLFHYVCACVQFACLVASQKAAASRAGRAARSETRGRREDPVVPSQAAEVAALRSE